MATWYSSDFHLFHRNIMKFCPYSRKGVDYIDMSNRIIQNMMDTVPHGDDLYILGDVSFGKYDETLQLLKPLGHHCRMHLILGNHDKESDMRSMGVFQSVQDYLEISVNKRSVVMSHYPMKAWNKGHHSSFHLHGHVHSGWQPVDTGRFMDVGIDTRAAGDMKPYSWAEIENILKHEPRGAHHD